MDHGDRSATGQDADGDQGRVGIVKDRIREYSQAHVQEIARRLGLMNGGIKAPECEREIDGIDVVQEAAAEGETSQRGRGDQDRGIQRQPGIHEAGGWEQSAGQTTG